MSSKFDEFGGPPITATILTDTQPALGTCGEPVERRLIVSGIPKDLTKHEVHARVSAIISAASSSYSERVISACIDPVFNIQFLTLASGFRSAMVEFRTPAAASVFLRSENGMSCRRPRDFFGAEKDPEDLIEVRSAFSPDGYSLSTDPVLTESHAAAVSVGLSNRITFSGFPARTSQETIKAIFGQFGATRNFQVGSVDFANVFDAVACELALNGTIVGGERVKVVRTEVRKVPEESAAPADQPLALPAASPSALPPANPTLLALAAPHNLQPSVLARINANPVLASQMKASREIGSKPSSVVQLLNAVYPEDLTDDVEYLALVDEVKSEASKHGTIEQVRILRPNPDLTAPPGCGKIFVHFTELSAARKFQLKMNGRLFDGVRTTCAAFYPVERFLQGKFTLYG